MKEDSEKLEKIENQNQKSLLRRIMGFEWSDIADWNSFVRLLSRPTDPASLAIVRILFGILMMLDIPQERGLNRLHHVAPNECHFPLFDFIKPLPVQWMYIVYLFMFAGAFGMAIGFMYRSMTTIYVVSYWYLFLLDTTNWNNHSFLFGVLATLFLFTDANQCWSLDNFIRSSSRRTKQVPLWNYTLIRSQIFLVYFIAGLKKTNPDWLGGYSMRHLSSHWIFTPFRLFLSREACDFHLVHHFGFIFDLTIGFFMFLDRSRPLAFVFCAAFNLMNSFIFYIGMFPYVMLATMVIFCPADWPRSRLRFFQRSSVPSKLSSPSVDLDPKKFKKNKENSHCLYPERKIGRYHSWAAGLTIVHIAVQLFLPYSHFITQGYNHWSDGLYGYSWNMMVERWETQHLRVTVKDVHTNQVHFIDPEIYGPSKRWTRYARLAKQFAHCVQRDFRSIQGNSTELKIFVDVWASLNRRFVQRMFDPRVDLLTADWSPIRRTSWTMPLLENINDHWRDKIITMSENQNWEQIFIADFPGFFLETWLTSNSLDLTNTNLEVLQGQIIVQTLNSTRTSNVTVTAGNKIKIHVDKFYRIHVISDYPAAYIYKSVNVTVINDHHSHLEKATNFWLNKFNSFEQSFRMMKRAIVSILGQTTFNY